MSPQGYGMSTDIGLTMDGMAYIQPVILSRMPQQADCLGADDDWTGVTSPAERRRLQNRINQRTYRKRKANQTKLYQAHIPKSVDSAVDFEDCCSYDAANSKDGSGAEIEIKFQDNGFWRLSHSDGRIPKLGLSEVARVETICKLNSTETRKVMSEFENWAEKRRAIGSPNTDHLLTLVKFNVFRALVSNSKHLGLSREGCMPDNALSPFTDPSSPKSRVLALPPALRPTTLQCEIPHHPWIDQLPIPGMRDNLLLAGDTYDDMELCGDLVGFFSASTGRAGMIIWGEPCDPTAWEVTESFLTYWGWTIRGCSKLLESTNYWRERRGESPLIFKRVILEEVKD